MSDIATIRAASLARLPETVERLGGSFKRAMRRATFDQRIIEASEKFIHFDVLLGIVQACTREVGDPVFALHYAETLGPEDLGAFGYLIASSATVGDLFRTALRYKSWYEHGTEWNFYTSKDLSAYTIHAPEHVSLNKEYYNGIYAVATMAWLQSRMTDLAGMDAHPARILLELDKPAYASELEHFFQVPLHFGQKVNAFVFDKSYLNVRLPNADPLLQNILKHYLDMTRPHLPENHGLEGTVERCIVESIQDGRSNVLDTAARLGMSVRTLQRRLEAHGLTYSAVASKAGHELALFYLRTTDLPIKQIAFLLGYTDVSNFNRAFRRWSGTSPGRIREEPFLASTLLPAPERGSAEDTAKAPLLIG